MDPVTQVALGAAVGEAVLGRRVGRRAMLWGAVCGLLPDLDVLLPLGDAVKDFTYHRSASHSLFVLALLTPLVVRLILKLHPQTTAYRGRWFILVYGAFATHVLLDSFTVYGTQLFWPLRTPPVMWSTIFIIDPVYTLPLLAGVLAALVLTRHRPRGHILNTVGLVLSSAYLLWTVGAKLHVNEIAHESLERQGIAYEQVLTVPTPLNSILWRVLVMDQNGYFEGFYSLMDGTGEIRFKKYPNEKEWLLGIEDHWPVKRLQWFTRGFYAVQRHSWDIVMTDLRMGSEPDYVFQFKVGELGESLSAPAKSERIVAQRNWEQLTWVWKRIWDDQAEA
jgi:inner membrane protein